MSKDKKLPRGKGVYIVSVTDAVSHERLWSRPFSVRSAVTLGASALVLIIALVFAIVAFTPIRTFIPGYPSASTKRQAIQNAVRIDSLEREILQWQLYTENLRRVVSGEEPLRLDSLILLKGAGDIPEDTPFDPELDSLLRSRLGALDYEE